jgi:hypothetical protein
MTGKIQNAIAKNANQQVAPAQQSVNQLMNSMLDGEKLRGRFNELLGNRSAQFVSSLVSMVNASPDLQKAFYEAPMTVIQAGLKPADGSAVHHSRRARVEHGSRQSLSIRQITLGMRGCAHLPTCRGGGTLHHLSCAATAAEYQHFHRCYFPKCVVQFLFPLIVRLVFIFCKAKTVSSSVIKHKNRLFPRKDRENA